MFRSRGENNQDYICDLSISTEIYKVKTQDAYLSTKNMLRSERIIGLVGYGPAGRLDMKKKKKKKRET
jgi:hypothetical protein